VCGCVGVGGGSRRRGEEDVLLTRDEAEHTTSQRGREREGGSERETEKNVM